MTIPSTVPQRSEIPEGLTNYPVCVCVCVYIYYIICTHFVLWNTEPVLRILNAITTCIWYDIHNHGESTPLSLEIVIFLLTVHLEPKHAAAQYMLYSSNFFIYLMTVFCLRLTSIMLKHESKCLTACPLARASWQGLCSQWRPLQISSSDRRTSWILSRTLIFRRDHKIMKSDY